MAGTGIMIQDFLITGHTHKSWSHSQGPDPPALIPESWLLFPTPSLLPLGPLCKLTEAVSVTKYSPANVGASGNVFTKMQGGLVLVRR